MTSGARAALWRLAEDLLTAAFVATIVGIVVLYAYAIGQAVH